MANGMAHARERAKPPAKELDHVRLYPAANGGHVVEHHFKSMEHPPEKYPFSKGDGAGLHAHLKQHLGVQCAACSEDSAAAEENSEL